MSLCRGPPVAAAATRHYRSNTSTSLRVVDIAAEHRDVIATIRKKLEERGVALPPAHFANTDVELTRYAITVGLLAAHTTADRCTLCLHVSTHRLIAKSNGCILDMCGVGWKAALCVGPA